MAFHYDNQAIWADLPGSQAGKQRQSPIDIITKDVVLSAHLGELTLANWDSPVDGTLANNGHSVQFSPSAGSPQATFRNHRGTYVLQQFHFHWGRREGEGSEHRVDGQQYEAELHLVHLKEGASTSDTDGDTYSVIGAFCQVDTTGSVDGIWHQLEVPKQYKQSLAITGIKYADFLPKSLDYYYYEGSLTTPPCTEVVQWFLLKEPIKIPALYLEALREMQEDKEGKHLHLNYRNVQALNGRQVQSPLIDFS